MPTLRAPVRGSLRDHGRERDERRRVARPAALDREQAEVDVVAGEHDLLARRRARTVFGRESAIDFSFFEAAHLLGEPLRRLHLEHVLELRADVVEPLDAEAPGTCAARCRTG